MKGAAVAVGLVLVGLLPGCAARQAVPVSEAGPAAVARVGLTDFAVTSRPLVVLPGEVRLEVTNAGATLHDLVVRGRGGEWRTPFLRAGQTARLVVTAEAGESLELWCSVAGHDAAGMRSVLEVATP